MVEPFEGGEFFVNGDSVGAASKGWKQISVKPGEHAIKFVAAEGDFQKTFEKKVKIIDKQIEEVIFDTNNEEFTFSYLGETKDGRERFLKKYPVFKKDRYFTLHGDDSRISTVYYMFKSNGDYCEKVNSFGVLYFSCSNGKDTVVLNEKGGWINI